MKFTLKIILSVMAIISIIFSIAGMAIINSNFEHSFEQTLSQNIDSYKLERYGLKNNIDSKIDENGEISKTEVNSYARNLNSYLENSRKFCIYIEDEEVYSNMEIDNTTFEKLKNAENITYIINDIESNKYMFISSKLDINDTKIILISRYDITNVFTERNRQLTYFYEIDIAVILISAISICILSILLTRPIIKLNETSKKIAKGQYNERIKLKSNDEIGELAKSFNMMIETIEKKIDDFNLSIKQREEFITNFTHELKNPMTSIIGYADILKSGKYDDETNIKSATYIFNEAKRLEKLSHKLMDLMGLSKENINIEKVDINSFMNELYNTTKDELGNIRLQLDVEKSYVLADKVLLEDCLRNLIDNSKKANPKDYLIKIIGKREKGKYKVSVIDSGCGIPEEEIPRITESFYMVDKARARNNGRNGIGLSICEKIAELHKSQLIIESKLGKGTKVSMYLEVANDEV